MKYKSPIFLLLLLIAPSFSSAQSNSFSGKIVYEYTFENPNNGADLTANFTPFFGSEQHYYIDGLNYKSYNAKGELTQLYNSDTNTYYYQNPQDGSILKMNAAEGSEESITVKHENSTDMILGKELKKVTIISDGSKTIYWYNSEISVDHTVFENHKFGDWGIYLEATDGALPLKYIAEVQGFLWISTAISIEEMTFEKGDFDIEKINSIND